MKVQPITEVKDIRSIKKLLSNKSRDKLLFVMGINTGLRVQDILEIKTGEVRDATIGDRISFNELKTGKVNVLIINKEIRQSLDDYFNESDLKDTDYLFKSRKGRNYPLSTHAVTIMVKMWTESVNLKGNYGAHTLRKTWCYIQRKEFGVSWELIAKRLNHSNPAVTRRYLGVKEEEVEEILLNGV